MKKFLVSNKVVLKKHFNIGIMPGKFDTKQLILSTIAILKHESYDNIVYFIRTTNPEELSKCQLFINDDFTTLFPVIPSYHDVAKQWVENSPEILNKYGVYDEESLKVVTESVEEKISNFEVLDCLMDLYSSTYSEFSEDSFQKALKITYELVEKAIMDSVNERIYSQTVIAYIEKADTNYITPPIYVQGWRNIVKCHPKGKNIMYAVFPDDRREGTLVIEAFDKSIIMKKHVKGMPGISYSGRFFIKVNNMETAFKVIDRLPKNIIDKAKKYA